MMSTHHKKIIWRWEEYMKVEIKKDNLWLLLYWHALQLKDKDNGLDNSKLKLETRYRMLEDDECLNLGCYSNEVVLTLENATKGDDLKETAHLYTPSLVRPTKKIAPVCKSFTKKEEGKNSMELLFDLQNWDIEIIFLFMLRAQSTFCKEKVWKGVESEVELVWVIGRPKPSPIIMSSEPSYEAWINILLK